MKKNSRFLRTAGAAAALASCALLASPMAWSEEVKLTGANEVPPVSSEASGSGTVTVHPDHTVTADIKVTGMKATAAHIHEGAAGANGKILVPFKMEGPDHFVAPPGAKLSEEGYKAYQAGDLYVNVHSAEHKAGEVRAQLAGH